MMTELEYGATKVKIERENEKKLKNYPILQKQLDIAVKCLKNYKSGTTDKWFAEVALEQIEGLNEISKQE